MNHSLLFNMIINTYFIDIYATKNSIHSKYLYFLYCQGLCIQLNVNQICYLVTQHNVIHIQNVINKTVNHLTYYIAALILDIVLDFNNEKK